MNHYLTHSKNVYDGCNTLSTPVEATVEMSVIYGQSKKSKNTFTRSSGTPLPGYLCAIMI